MHLPKATFILILCITVFIPQLLVAETAVVAETFYLFGKIGEHRVIADLSQYGEKLSGWYFYQSHAKQIRLEGRIDSKGSFRIEETMDGRKTGFFEGNVKKGSWTGTWRKAAGAAPLPLYLQENHDNLKNLNGSYTCTVKERDKQFHYTYDWELKLVVERGIVMKLYTSTGSTGDNGDEQQCSIELGNLKQAESDMGILLEDREASAEDSNKCSVRIVGNADVLWIIIGNSSAPAACRTNGERMFCSPRGSWNDIVLDRRTRKCKALR